MKIKLFIKTVITVIVMIFYNVFMRVIDNFISPIIANYLAMNQMNNSVDSSLGIQVYTYMSNYSWTIVVFVLIAIYLDDLITILGKIKEKKNEEN